MNAAPLPIPDLIPPDVQADTDAVIESVMTGRPLDPEIARRVHERGERVRREIFEKHGVLDVAVDLIRQARDEE